MAAWIWVNCAPLPAGPTVRTPAAASGAVPMQARAAARKRGSGMTSPCKSRLAARQDARRSRPRPGRACVPGPPGTSGRLALDRRRAGLVGRPEHDLAQVHVPRARQREEDHLCDVGGGEDLEPGVRLLRALGVAAEAHERELRLDEPRVDRREADALAGAVEAQRL